MPQSNQIIKIISPKTASILSEDQPTFLWELLSSTTIKVAYFYIYMVDLKENEVIDDAIKNNDPIFPLPKHAGRIFLPLPAKEYQEKVTSPLFTNKAYAYKILGYDANNNIVASSETGMFFIQAKGLPANLLEQLNCQNNLLDNDIYQWKIAYGNPQIHRGSNGCRQAEGTIELTGNAISGDAVIQPVSIEPGKRYSISLCALSKLQKPDDFVKLRFYAVNRSLAGSNHPEPDVDIQVIYETSAMTKDDWTQFILPPWRAYHNFSQLVITAVSNDSKQGECEISGICFSEYTQDDCGSVVDAFVSDSGEIITPDGLKEYTKPNQPAEISELSFDRGSTIDIYGDMFDANGELTWYQDNLECASIGGALSDETLEKIQKPKDIGGGVSKDDLAAVAETIVKQVEGFWTKASSKFKPLEPEKSQNCSTFHPNKNLPFEGRDIIYVHGLDLDHIIDRVVLNTLDNSIINALQGIDPSFMPPSEEVNIDYPSSDFPGVLNNAQRSGYYIDKARDYWHHHIEHYLKDVDKPTNRYLVVSFNCNQRITEGAHAVLKQIRDAMSDGIGVVDKANGTGTQCFGRDAVIISHSTGALLTNVAMSLADQSSSPGSAEDYLGDVSYISKRIRTHISLHGAIAGSNLGLLAVMGTNIVGASTLGASGIGAANLGVIDTGLNITSAIISIAPSWVSDALTPFLRSSSLAVRIFQYLLKEVEEGAINAITTVNKSVLIDLIPLYTKLVLREIIDKNPIPVLTVAGGHPSVGITGALLAGLDDGVVNTNSQSGSCGLNHPDTYIYPFSLFPLLNPVKSFDLGINELRSLPYGISQFEGFDKAAYGSMPFLSPTGMLQPVGTFSLPDRYKNHYTFLQSASDHNDPITQDNPSWGQYKRTLSVNNCEETLVVTNGKLFYKNSDLYLINPSIKRLVHECVKGEDLVISLYIPSIFFNRSTLSFRFIWLDISIVIPLWRRTYHRLIEEGKHCDYDCDKSSLQECDYVYRYVLRK